MKEEKTCFLGGCLSLEKAKRQKRETGLCPGPVLRAFLASPLLFSSLLFLLHPLPSLPPLLIQALPFLLSFSPSPLITAPFSYIHNGHLGNDLDPQRRRCTLLLEPPVPLPTIPLFAATVAATAACSCSLGTDRPTLY